MNDSYSIRSTELGVKPCFCVGPQPGETMCPCALRRMERYRKIPIIPPLPDDINPTDPNPTVAICGECGMHIKRVMGFVCGNSRCPVQLKAMC